MRKYRNIKGNLEPKRILKYSEEWIEYRKSRGANSIKVGHCDVDTDGFDDSIVRGWRSPAAGKTQTCIPLPPAAGPTNLKVPPPEFGPLSLESLVVIPQLGPTGLSAEHLASSLGPASLGASIVAPAAGPLDLTNASPPVAGPQSLSISVAEPEQGPSSLQFILPPVGGPTSLSSFVIMPSSLTLTPWQNNTSVGGPILGMPSATKIEFSGTDQVRVSTQGLFVYTQTWGVGSGPPPMMRATFQRWVTNIPGYSNSTDPIFVAEGPWVNGRAYSVRPMYTTQQLN